jgi:hypothetical protein
MSQELFLPELFSQDTLSQDFRPRNSFTQDFRPERSSPLRKIFLARLYSQETNGPGDFILEVEIIRMPRRS